MKEPKKICPLCNEEYTEEDNYCGSDGTRLAILAPIATSSKALPSRDVVSKAITASGRENDQVMDI